MEKAKAIENLMRIRNMHNQRVFGAINDEEDEALAMAIEALEQPEIIRCRDCDWWTKQPDSIPSGRCKGCPYVDVIRAQTGFMFLGCRHEPYHGKWVAEIKSCPKRGEAE